MKLLHFPAAKNADLVFVLRTASLQGKALIELRRELRALATAGRRLVLDLSTVLTLNSAAAELIVEIAARLRKIGGGLRLTGLSNSAAAFLELFRVSSVVEMTGRPTDPVALPIAA